MSRMMGQELKKVQSAPSGEQVPKNNEQQWIINQMGNLKIEEEKKEEGKVNLGSSDPNDSRNSKSTSFVS